MSDESGINVEVEVYVYPTEDVEKVKSAVNNIIKNLIFKTEELTKGTKILRGRANGKDALRSFKDLLNRRRIRTAAKAIILSSMTNNSISFYLNKQVAFAHHVSFSMPTAESPLGPIKVKVKSKRILSLIDWLVQDSRHSYANRRD